MTIENCNDTLCSGSSWGQKRLYEDMRSIRKLMVASKDKDKHKGKDWSIRKNDFLGKVFII